MKPTPLTANTSIIRPLKTMTNQASSQIKEAIKELIQKFLQIPEIGKFKPIKVPVAVGNQQAKATISIEPSILPQDYRTRVLTFTIKKSYPNGAATTIHEMSPAIGNKYSIESALKNPKTIKIFEDFIKTIEA